MRARVIQQVASGIKLSQSIQSSYFGTMLGLVARDIARVLESVSCDTLLIHHSTYEGRSVPKDVATLDLLEELENSEDWEEFLLRNEVSQ